MVEVSTWTPHAVAISAALVMTYVCFHPILFFVQRGWRIRHEDVLASPTREAKLAALAPLMSLVPETAVARVLVAGTTTPAAIGVQAQIPFLILAGRAVAAIAGAYL